MKRKNLTEVILRLSLYRMKKAMEKGDVKMAENAYNDALMFEIDEDLLGQGFMLTRLIKESKMGKWKRLAETEKDKSLEEEKLVFKPTVWEFS